MEGASIWEVPSSSVGCFLWRMASYIWQLPSDQVPNRGKIFPHGEYKWPACLLQRNDAVRLQTRYNNMFVTLGNYSVGRLLGSGTYGIVCAAYDCEGHPFAIKSIHVGRRKATTRVVAANHEVTVMKAINKHKNCIRLHEVIETSDTIHLVMELAEGGDLRDYLNTHGPQTEDEARSIFTQILSAVQHAHKQNYVHRDLKLDNILLDCSGNIKVADWGFACRWSAQTQLQDAVGSLHYAAPEVLQQLPYQGPEIDCWSLGVILYALVTATLPFMVCADEENENALRERIIHGDFAVPASVSTCCASLIRNLLETDPKRRFGLDDVMLHPWITGVITPTRTRYRAATPRANARHTAVNKVQTTQDPHTCTLQS